MSKRTLSFAGILIAFMFLLVINTNIFGSFCGIPCAGRETCYWSEGDPADGHCYYTEYPGGGWELNCVWKDPEPNCDLGQTFLCCLEDTEAEECWLEGGGKSK